MDLGVYIHIPFCKSKCGYCDFISHSNREELFLPYKNALLNEIRAFDFSSYDIKTIFIGGGTPTVLPPYYLAEILSEFKTASSIETTVETNPNTADAEALKMLKSAGASRLSIGLQAWQDRLLKVLGRTHSQEEFVKCFDMARQAGFDNINVDIMFSLPSQTADELAETLEKVTTLKPEHISLYGLIIAEDTPFTSYVEPDETLDREMYYMAKKFLKEKKYTQYEISNFALNGRECKHNLAYWDRVWYKGFGAAAHSFLNSANHSAFGERMRNVNEVERYIIQNETEDIILLSDCDAMSEFMFLGLRKTSGIKTDEFDRLFSRSIFDIYGWQIEKFTRSGHLRLEDNRLLLTDKGVDVSNTIFTEFLL